MDYFMIQIPIIGGDFEVLKNDTHETIKNAFGSDLLVHIDSAIFNGGYETDKNIAWLLEPMSIMPMSYDSVRADPYRYNRIFTHNKDYMEQFDNSIDICYTPFGGCWIDDSESKIYHKTKNISMIASFKKDTMGHKLRHSIIDSLGGNFDVMGNGYKQFENKVDGLADYKFSVVIENERTRGFFTEKIIDCFATGTIPIYWGDPAITDIFNSDGIFQFSNINELVDIISNINNETYESRLYAVKDNFEICKEYKCILRNMTRNSGGLF